MFTQTIRRQFLQYFRDRGHAIISSSPVIPHEDPTLLFINAGMNQFKDVFLGESHRDYIRATTSQKCIRVGGKHNDLENVGHTSRHLTFFEMLGNFSFGDYFKKEAIQFAWEVSTQVFGLDGDRIWPTIFLDDDEAFELWQVYVPASRITRFGEKENFWAMGDTGPCGPCSELLYDRGAHYGYAKNPSEDPSGERFLEFWNLVFMQYNRQASGQKDRLPKPSIDTGSGLERVVSLKMGVESVFETDVLRSLISQVEVVTGIVYHSSNSRSAAFRVIADHLRCLAFAIADGVQPSNIDRGYVLRKVLRRAVRYGRQLGMDKPFLAAILPQLVSTMGEDYPELVKGKERIAEILTVEEEAFIRTLKRGGNILNQVIEKAQTTNHLISGEDAFKLKDTYGLPLEEILLIAKDSNLHVDETHYQALEQEAKERSRSVHKNVNQLATENIFADFAKQQGESRFVGYDETTSETQVIGLIANGTWVQQLEEGQEGLVILKSTPFYTEMGGQVGDTGIIEGDSTRFVVENCVSPYKGVSAHEGKLYQGILRINDTVQATIDRPRRQKIANNHTATHLLHWALHQILGEHVKQAGSVVDPQRLRFDFSHHKALSLTETRQIEDLVNAKIRENSIVNAYEIKYEEAQKRDDIKQFFGEKYGSVVRVVDINYSKELCGGTHTANVGNIGLFRIAKESSIAAGVRRIEAVTGQEAERINRQQEDQLLHLAQTLKIPAHQLQERLEKLLEENRSFTQEMKTIRQNQLHQLTHSLIQHAQPMDQGSFVIAKVDIPADELRACVDLTLDRLKSGIVILGCVTADKCQLVAKVSDDYVKQGYSAHELLKIVLTIVEGSGGGKPQQAQGAGKLPERLTEALEKVKDFLASKTR
jgi:alanyl-tRNA synthetase